MTRRRVGSLTAAVSASLLALLLVVTISKDAAQFDESPGITSAFSGLAPEAEVPLRRVWPEPGNPDFVQTHAYQVAGLPAMSVGRPGPAAWEAAGREPDPAFVCSGGGGAYSCTLAQETEPAVHGVRFGGPFVQAWSWFNVPDEAVAVQFTDEHGTVTWQRPLDGIVMFAHTVPRDAVGDCACQFDALSASGDVLVAVHVGKGKYLSRR